jgi:ribonuclease P protein component
MGAVVDDWAAPAAPWPAATGAAAPAKRAARTTRLWLGLVVPKRHARRSVTRQLVRRQIRACFEGAADRLDSGLWIVRLRAPFARQCFPSAASAALRAAVRSELTDAFARASRAPRRPPDAPTA